MPISKLRPSFTFTEDRLKELQAVVPEAFADGRINWDTLREALGEALEDEAQEHFGLFWPGKREARRLAAMPSKGTLIPQPGTGVDEDNTHNLFIEGDNLEVLKLLQKSYAGRVKMIYIDPPYNTGNDFVYPDDYSEPLDAYLQRTGQADEEGQLLTTNSRASGRYHSTWLNMIYPRILLARHLLKNDGVIFISIDENEVHHLRQVLNEVFGEENFIVSFVWQKGSGTQNDNNYIAVSHEYILCYAKSKEDCTFYKLPPTKEMLAVYDLSDEFEQERGKHYLRNLNDFSIGDRPGLHYDITCPDGTILIGKKHRWRCDINRFKWRIDNKRIVFQENDDGVWQVLYKQYINETKEQIIKDNNGRILSRGRIAESLLMKIASTGDGSKDLKELDMKNDFSYPKPVSLIKHFLTISTLNDDIVLDFFAGSGTTAQAVIEQNLEDSSNRKFILVQLPEPIENASYTFISEITKERIRRVINKYNKERKGGLKLGNEMDLGVKVSKLDRSSFKEWEHYSGKESSQLELRFEQAETPLVEGWQLENLLTEILLLQGFPLDSKVRSLPEFKANNVQQVTSEFIGHHLYVCLDKKVKAETVAKINLRPEDILVCLDSALSDEAKVKLADQCNLKVI